MVLPSVGAKVFCTSRHAAEGVTSLRPLLHLALQKGGFAKGHQGHQWSAKNLAASVRDASEQKNVAILSPRVTLEVSSKLE